MAILSRTEIEALNNPSKVVRADKTLLEDADLRVWTGDQIFGVCRSPLLLARLKNWRAFAIGDLPQLSDMYTSEEEGALEDAMLLLQQAGDFIYVFQGSESIRKYGRNFRGAALSKIQGPMSAKMLAMYNTCIRDRAPAYCQFIANVSEQHVCWERISLPLIADGAKFVLSYSMPLDDKLEILTAIFDRSPIGMIAAAAELGENRPLASARISLINGRARDILKLKASAAAVRTVQDLRQWIKDVAGWTQLTETSQGETSKRQTIRYEEKETGRRFMIMIEPVGRYVVFHLIEADS